MIGLQRHSGAPQVSLHSDAVDQLPHDPNCAGQVLEAWQVEAVAITASRIASGSLVNAAWSISGVGVITARAMTIGAASLGESSSMWDAGADTAGVDSGSAGGAWLVWPAAEQAHTLHATAMTTARARMSMKSSLVGTLAGASWYTLGPGAGTAAANCGTRAATAAFDQDAQSWLA
ncbi:MAG TPA: hypothetical protein VHW23_23935 [Kofleriaceae bacterium]|jgi:hypothetical protein|nr:hypothetical protein [Kofleriaceae bacterium]